MRKTLTYLILATALGLSPDAARALPVPAGKAAVIEALIGKVSLLQAGKSIKPKVGQALDFGAELNTGTNGRLSLRHADNAVTRVAPNTELTLKAPGAKKGIFLRLKLGAVRYLVGKRAPGEVFEVETNNAVAAVKGTDAETSTDGKRTRSSVFESAREKALELIDSKTGKSEELSPGETGEADEDGLDSHDLTEDEKDQSEKNYEGLPEPELGTEGEGQGGEQGGQPGQTTQGDGQQASEGESSGEESSDLTEEIEDAFAAVLDDLGLDSFLERDDRTGDLVAGRIVYDRNGDRTQVSAYIVRPEPNVIYKANFSRRDTGPFTGTSSAEEITTWSSALPENWHDAVNMAMDDPANLGQNGYPILYRVSQEFIALNPQLDELYIYTDYAAPRYMGFFDGNGYTIDPGYIIDGVQAFVRDVYTNGSLVFTHELSQSTVNDYMNAGQVLSTGSWGYYSSWNTTQTVTPDGGISLAIDTFGPAFLTMEFRVLDADGTLHDLSDLPSGLVQGDFRGLDESLNLEVTFNAPNFSAPIDLMFIPSVFDSMDILDLLVPSNGGA